jgi:hypothetical protein
MTISTKSIAATFAALWIGGVSISAASAAVNDHAQRDKSLSQQEVSDCAKKQPYKTDRKKESEDGITATLLRWGWE